MVGKQNFLLPAYLALLHHQLSSGQLTSRYDSCRCAPCALCQETRTMFSNNVQHGVWHGQTPPVIAASAYSVPGVEDMKVDYAPVHAKDFV